MSSVTSCSGFGKVLPENDDKQRHGGRKENRLPSCAGGKKRDFYLAEISIK